MTNPVTSLPETTSTAQRVKVAGVSVTDDGLGASTLSVTGPDAGAFEVDASGLYLKAGTVLDHTTKPSYTVSVAVDDPSAGGSPDATSAPYTLTITAPPPLAPVRVTEVSPWSSGNSPYAADWFEATNTGTQPVDLTGWKMDDSSNALASAVPLTGVASIAPGQSAIFTEGEKRRRRSRRPGSAHSVPAGFAIGSYSGSGVGLSTDGDAVNLFDSFGRRVTGVELRRLDERVHVRQRGGRGDGHGAQRRRRQRRVQGRQRGRLAGRGSPIRTPTRRGP